MNIMAISLIGDKITGCSCDFFFFEIFTNKAIQVPKILPFPSELPLSELGFDHFIAQSHCQPFFKTQVQVIGANLQQNCGMKWKMQWRRKCLGSLKVLAAEPPCGGDAGISSPSCLPMTPAMRPREKSQRLAGLKPLSQILAPSPHTAVFSFHLEEPLQ